MMTLDEIKQFAKVLADALRIARRGESQIVDHARALSGLNPEVVRLDHLLWEGTIGGSTLTQPADVTTPTDMLTDVMGIMGYISSPGVAVDNFPRITFNITKAGSIPLFGSDFSMAQLLNILGPMPPIFWPRSLRRYDPGSLLKCTFTRGTGWNTSGDNRTVGVSLIVGYVVSKGVKNGREEG